MNHQKETHHYDDIIQLPHHVSSRHPPMPAADRAAQFAPFAALTGYEAAIREAARLTDGAIELSEDRRAILDQKQQLLVERLGGGDRPEITVTFFRPDGRKEGGAYLTVAGRVKKIDSRERSLVLEDKTRIPLDSILELESDLFDRLL